MNHRVASSILSLCIAIRVFGQEVPTESPITRLGLFKNGIALVEHMVDLRRDGTYVLVFVPREEKKIRNEAAKAMKVAI